jgi:hypothetical protein
MNIIDAMNSALRYTGRIDFSNPSEPTLIQAGSSIHVRFTGTSVAIRGRNHHGYFENAIGFLVDGTEDKAVLENDDAVHEHTLARGLKAGAHELVIWKRSDGGYHYYDFIGLVLDDGATVMPLGERPARRIECYGDSVSAGEVCEANDRVGMSDPEPHDGKYSNARHSYVFQTARNLGAEAHDNAQGGIALLDGTGYFVGGKVGLVSTWDKLRYNPSLGPCTDWDFSAWTPHVAVMAIGQNDNHPDDYISTDAARRDKWKDTYAKLLRSLREKYPKALIVVITTLLFHNPGWDDSLDEIVNALGDARIVRHRFARNGSGTPGHLRVSEHAEMATELTTFLQSFGDDLWH